MRHTLTLEPDIDAAIAETCRSTGKSFKEVVNSTLRQGLLARRAGQLAVPLEIRPVHMGFREGISLVSISAIEGLIEVEGIKNADD